MLDLVRIFQGFIDEQTRVPGGAAVFFSDVATDVFAAKSALYHLQTLVGDGMLVSEIIMFAWVGVQRLRSTVVILYGGRNGRFLFSPLFFGQALQVRLFVFSFILQSPRVLTNVAFPSVRLRLGLPLLNCSSWGKDRYLSLQTMDHCVSVVWDRSQSSQHR